MAELPSPAPIRSLEILLEVCDLLDGDFPAQECHASEVSVDLQKLMLLVLNDYSFQKILTE